MATNPAPMSLAAAEDALVRRGGYEWALGGRLRWSAAQIAEKLSEMGIETTQEWVTNQMKGLPGLESFRGLGYRIPRASLILWLASMGVNP